MMSAAFALLAAAQIVTLDEAVQPAREHHHKVGGAGANTAAAGARASQALAPLLPQLSATAGYQRTTANAITRPGQPSVGPAGSVNPTHGKFATFNSYSDNISASQLIFDFGSQPNRWRAARAQAEAQEATERATALQVDFNVRSAYFTARANRALAQVARENLDNLTRHLEQTEGMVQAGTRAAIHLVQARTDTANARVALINPANPYH